MCSTTCAPCSCSWEAHGQAHLNSTHVVSMKDIQRGSLGTWLPGGTVVRLSAVQIQRLWDLQCEWLLLSIGVALCANVMVCKQPMSDQFMKMIPRAFVSCRWWWWWWWWWWWLQSGFGRGVDVDSSCFVF